jgi:hypothetical protein
MRFESSLGAIGLAVVAVVAISQTSLAQSPIDKTAGATAKFIAIGTLASPGSMPAQSLALLEEQATLRLYLNGKVEQFSAKTERASSFSWRPARARKLRDFFRSCRMPKRISPSGPSSR